MQDQLINIYQSFCRYKITDGIQPLDFAIDYNKVHSEISEFLIENEFGFNSVSLRLTTPSTNNQDYVNKIEDVRLTAVAKNKFKFYTNLENKLHNKDYIHWHPDLEGSYTQSLVSKIEEFSGFPIGRIRLAWLLPNDGYGMHIDMEPMRFHIPLITNKFCYFIQENKLYHMEAGNLYQILTASEHTAENFGNLPRLHLVFSTYHTGQLESEILNFFSDEKYNEIFCNHMSDLDDKSISTLIKLSSVHSDNELAYSTKTTIKSLLAYKH